MLPISSGINAKNRVSRKIDVDDYVTIARLILRDCRLLPL